VARRSEEVHVQPARARRDASIVRVGTNGDVRELPDFRGLSAREALRIMTRIGVTARLNGSGVVTSQVPAPGTLVEPGMACEVRLERPALSAGSMSVGP
jgi:hypothetical protein